MLKNRCLLAGEEGIPRSERFVYVNETEWDFEMILRILFDAQIDQRN